MRPFDASLQIVDAGLLRRPGPAIVLDEETHVRFLSATDPSAGVRLRHHQTILVLNRAGLDVGRVSYPLDYDDRLISVRARSWSSSGSEKDAVQLDPHAIAYAEYSDTAAALYSGTRVMAFDVPGVATGRVVEVEVEIESASPPAGARFGGRLPVERSRFSIEIPRGWKIHHAFAEKGELVEKPPQIEQLGASERWTWEARDLAAENREEQQDQGPRLWISVAEAYPDWPSVARWYEQLTAGLPKLDPSEVPAIGEGDPRRRIFEYVRDGVRYLQYYRESIDYFRPHSASVVLKSRFGDCKDMATLLIALYRAAGIEAHPVLLRLEKGTLFAREVPSPGAFNHVIVALSQPDGSYLFLDPTSKEAAFGAIPDYLAGRSVLVVRGDRSELVQIPTPSPEQNHERVSWKLAEDRAEVEVEVTGDASESWRGLLRDGSQRILRSAFSERYLAGWSGATIERLSVDRTEERLVLRAVIFGGDAGWKSDRRTIVPLARFFPAIDSLFPAAVSEIEVLIPLKAAKLERLPAASIVESPLRVEVRAEASADAVRISRKVTTGARPLRGEEEAAAKRTASALSREALVLQGAAK